ncbi:MAG: alanine--glyoxylate aminotransferase family protein [Candidatus Diapherotrites archaeon]|nr:alanine--glyoxylate aminotransferase family protein [Candidatus Diapherotrites archaeon]
MKLFIPGPININENTKKSIQKDMISHRSEEFRELYKECKIGLQEIFQTKNPVLISTSSGSGLMEGAIRNFVREKVLICVIGAFGKKWASIAKACGKEVDILEITPGKAIQKEDLIKVVSGKEYDAICITQNETSTGVANHLAELASIVRESEALLLVDAVSSMAGANIKVDEIGIDVCITSSQKCFALPPGLAFASVSEKALEKAKNIEGRGYYFDFLELAKNWENNETPYTPNISLLFALQEKVREIQKETIEKRFERHLSLAKRAQEWAVENGFELFAEENYMSNTVTCIKNTKKVDMKKVKEKMMPKGYFIDAGYRKLNEKLISEGKDSTFRIPHMGELTIEELGEYLEELKQTIMEVEK